MKLYKQSHFIQVSIKSLNMVRFKNAKMHYRILTVYLFDILPVLSSSDSFSRFHLFQRGKNAWKQMDLSNQISIIFSSHSCVFLEIFNFCWINWFCGLEKPIWVHTGFQVHDSNWKTENEYMWSRNVSKKLICKRKNTAQVWLIFP